MTSLEHDLSTVEDDYGIPREKVTTVSQLADIIDDTIETDGLQAAHVVGEVSNRREWKDNVFFTLKDGDAKLQCVIFSRHIEDYRPEEGDSILARGSLDFYREQGKLSLQANRVLPIGRGEYHRKLQQRKQELRDDGVFDRERELPDVPETVGVVTSEDSDAFHDIRESLHEAAPGVDILLAPSSVQGEDAIDELLNAIDRLEKEAVDLIVIGRGGGDLEALKPFNTEAIGRAIYTADLPVIAGIGHREDETVAGLAADRRAITPTEAGKAAAGAMEDIIKTLERKDDELEQAYRRFREMKEHQQQIERSKRRERRYRIAIAALIALTVLILLLVIL